jgi:hypothetical protein
MVRENSGRLGAAVRADGGGRTGQTARPAERPDMASLRSRRRTGGHSVRIPGLAVCCLSAIPGVVVAGDPDGAPIRVASVSPPVGTRLASRPLVRGLLPDPVARRLALAFPVALERVRTVPGCRALFDRLGGDGVAALASTRYSPAASIGAEGACRPGIAAFTVVRGPLSYLCAAYGTLDTRRAAATLIHEALHYAGLTERPSDPRGLSTHEINRMVRTQCGL